MPNQKLIVRFLQIATISVFLGRAWQHLFWDAPYRELLWDPDYLRGIVESLSSLSWKEFVTNPEVDKSIQLLIRVTGFIYLACAGIALFIERLPKSIQKFLWVGIINLILLAFLYSKEKFFHLGQFLEYSLQFTSPFFLYMVVNQLISYEKLIFWLKIAIAFTFTCHGLYAVGYYPIPESFHSMNMGILGLDQSQSLLFLKTVGLLDFLLSVMIFLPSRVAIVFLAYATVWGLATSMARVWANFYADFWMESLHQWTHETVLRFPHFVIPLMVLLLLKDQIANTSAKLTKA